MRGNDLSASSRGQRRFGGREVTIGCRRYGGVVGAGNECTSKASAEDHALFELLDEQSMAKLAVRLELGRRANERAGEIRGVHNLDVARVFLRRVKEKA